MFDAAQVLRHSIQPNQLESLQAYAPAEATSAQAAERGELMGTSFVVENDPLAELQDSMEELSFQFEEKSAKKLADRKLGETRNRRSAYVQALEGWMKTLPDLPNHEFLSRLLRQLRAAMGQGTLPDVRGLLKQLAEGSGDPSHQFAMLDVLEQALGEGEGDLRTLLTQTRTHLMESQGKEIRAGINLAQEVNARATSPEEMQGLRDLYRGEVLGFSTPQACFRSILQSRGAIALQATIDFLTAGCGVDLQSPNPSQTPEELRRILLDLQCVQVLKTVFDRMNALEARMWVQFHEHTLLSGEQMTGRVMEFTELAYVSSANIQAFIAACGLMKWLAKMDFCREMVAIFRQLSSRLFASENDRLRLVDAAQEELDELIAREGEDEDAEASA
ncbi:MAG: type III secretion system gatekeeper subunit SctW [Candidatus Spyradenecus sp.]